MRSVTLVLLSCFVAACPAPAPELPGESDRRAVLTRIADGVVLPTLANLGEASAALSGAVASQDRSAAQEAWRATMKAWQALEVIHLGPAGSPVSFTGGLGMREQIYAWPLVNLCAIDQQLYEGAFEQPGWADLRLPNVLGLAALEYVLFVEGTTNSCPADVALNSPGAWAELGEAELASRRARYASVLAADVDREVTALRDEWSRFAEILRNAGESGSPFPTAQLALDEVFSALYALELVTKDKKLALPAGLHVDCPTTSCPERLESRFARTSKENVLVNLETARQVFLGSDVLGADGPGFDDLLRGRGATDLAAGMAARLGAAIDATRAFEGSLEDALTSDPARVVALHDAVKTFTDEFKSTFPSTLGLRVPDEGAGDND